MRYFVDLTAEAGSSRTIRHLSSAILREMTGNTRIKHLSSVICCRVHVPRSPCRTSPPGTTVFSLCQLVRQLLRLADQHPTTPSSRLTIRLHHDFPPLVLPTSIPQVSLLAPHNPASPRLPSSRLADKHPTTVPPRTSQSDIPRVPSLRLAARHPRLSILSPGGPASHDSLLAPHSPTSHELPPHVSLCGFTTTSLLAPHNPASPRLPSSRLANKHPTTVPPRTSQSDIPRVPRASQPGTLDFPSTRLAGRHLMTYLLSPQWPAFPTTSLLQSQSGGPIFLLSPDNPASPRLPSSRLADKHPTTIPPRTLQSGFTTTSLLPPRSPASHDLPPRTSQPRFPRLPLLHNPVTPTLSLFFRPHSLHHPYRHTAHPHPSITHTAPTQ
ncbi:hypothetical protein J2T17_000473 [Paenibacillus mucilaginosus]